MIVPLLFAVASQTLNVNAAKVPTAKKVPVLRDIHGDKFVDPYFWFRNRKDPDLLKYLRANNAYSDAVMKPTKLLQAALYKEMVSRIQETDLSVPTFDRGYYYYSRDVKGKQYASFCRRKGSMKAREEVLVDPNVLGKNKSYFDVGAFEVSPNGNLLAYSVDTNGHRDYELYIKDLRTGKLLKDKVGVVDEVAWIADNKTLLYTTENKSKRTFRLHRRGLGSKPELLYEEKDEMFDISLSESRDHHFAFAISGSKETTECRSIGLDQPNAPVKLIAKRREGIEYYPEHRAGTLFIRTNDGAPEFRIVSTSTLDPSPDTWVDVVPEQPDATFEDLEVFKDFAVIQVRKDAVSSVNILNLTTNQMTPVKFPDAFYSAQVEATPDFNAKRLRLGYVSLVTPRTTYDYNLSNRKLELLKRQQVRGYKPASYTSELIWVTARDGVKVPVSLVSRKGVKKPAPMLLEAYGAYGDPNDPYFSTSMLSLMDRGFVVGTAHVRGGGEMGERWHDAGKMANKVTTFTDFIDCARMLEHLNITTRSKLCITGGSAGGLTIGAVTNMAPEICRAALVEVPFVDVINTMLDETIPLTTEEFIEWGNPKVEEQYRWIRAYSPYDNAGALDYPAMLVKTSLNDSQVPYWEPTKWVARMRDVRKDNDPLLLKINLDAGHGGSSGRYDALRERAYDFAFVLAMLGVNN